MLQYRTAFAQNTLEPIQMKIKSSHDKTQPQQSI
jgi:hypothetical protein